MSWAKTTLLLGVVLLVLGFAVGVEPSSTTVAGHTYVCNGAIQSSWLVPGIPSPSAGDSVQRQVSQQCGSLLHPHQWLTWTALALGALAALTGWTAQRTPPSAEAPTRRLPSLST
jgi:hypothetical protein